MSAWKQHTVIPGFRLSLGYTLFYVGLIILLPIAALVGETLSMSASQLWTVITDEQVLASFRLSFGTALFAASMNVVFGTLVAWVLVRYSFPAKRIFDALIDLPFALPTAVAGIALVAIYGPRGLLGEGLLAVGIKVAYTPVGVTLALIFVGFPFVVRTVQPILQAFECEIEEVSASLGASRMQTVSKVIIPQLFPALLTGFSLALARGIGEYGSVIFIAGNLPYVSEITPLLVVSRLERFDYTGATAIACSMLAFSLVILMVINGLQGRLMRRYHSHSGGVV
ncbi:sulfate ABC transporter permease subunit CysT [Vibrio ouci]|uniref:Sulfate transport system permease protein CysT n=1 Tax=Vibrio ouci TaxID=2499078 RepID=A0A4Y8WDD3_9VIBR|nr:sulfate ABC transporter permease subunit CysT [Vibrio ouci]TFH90281.1 sulfate ABC transporter permease subunit CysT [Vibrio ouci]